MKALPFHLIVLALFKNSHGDISANYAFWLEFKINSPMKHMTYSFPTS
jgi:hypothetical protein